jgi:hypothetical protein
MNAVRTGICPVTSARPFVRSICVSMSRSMMLLMTHAEAMAQESPRSVAARRKKSIGALIRCEANMKAARAVIIFPYMMPGFMSS